MLPHEVVRQVNTTAAQPAARPHSRQIAPTNRANGRFSTSPGANVRKAFEDAKPMISKAQVLRDMTQQTAQGNHSQQFTASTPPPMPRAGLSRISGGGLNNSYSHTASASSFSNAKSPAAAEVRRAPMTPQKSSAAGASPIRHQRPSIGAGNRSNTPPRVLGKAVINASNILPEELAAKSTFLSLSVGALSSTMPLGPTSNNTATPMTNKRLAAASTSWTSGVGHGYEVSLERTSPVRVRPPKSVLPPREDEVVVPGSTIHREGPDRSGFVPPKPARSNSPTANSQSPSSPISSLTGAAARPLTPPSSTMPVTSPSRGVRALQLVQQSRNNDSLVASTPTTTQLLRMPRGGDDDDDAGRVAKGPFSSSHVPAPIEASDLTMAQLLASYGMTSFDCVANEDVAQYYSNSNGEEVEQQGCSVLELAQTEGIEANLKTMALNNKPPANTFTTLIAPRMACNESAWIPCVSNVSGSQTRAVAVAVGKGTSSGVTGAPTAVRSTSPTRAESPAANNNSNNNIQHHLIVDLGHWQMIDHGPSIVIPAFMYKASIHDHALDRCLHYNIRTSDSSLFACGTPSVVDSERGLLAIVPNPNACGSATLTVYLEDVASVDPATGEALRSEEVTLYIHTMRTENTATNPASNGDGTPHPPLISSLPPDSAKKVIIPTLDAYPAVPITTKAAVRCDPRTGATTFVPDPLSLAAPPTSLHTPYAFPLPNLFEIREDSCLRDQMQCLLERAQAAAEAFDEATRQVNKDRGAASNEHTNTASTDLQFNGSRLDCAFPFSAVLSPCHRSVANAFETAAAILAPAPWRSTSLAKRRERMLAAAGDTGKELEEINTSGPSHLSSRVAKWVEKSKISESEEEVLCAMLERLAYVRVTIGGADEDEDGAEQQKTCDRTELNNAKAFEALETLARRRSAALGLSSMADIGVGNAILQSNAIKTHAEEQSDVVEAAEVLVDALILASRCFALCGRYIESLETAEAAARAADKYVGKDSKAHLAALLAVGTACGLRGDYVAAARSLETAVDISEMVCGANTSATALVIALLGTAFCQHGDLATGTGLLARSQRTLAAVLATRTSPSSPTPPAMLIVDIKLRLAVVSGLIAHWKSSTADYSGVSSSANSSDQHSTIPSITPAEVESVIHDSLIPAIVTAEEAITSHRSSQQRETDPAGEGGESNDSLTPSPFSLPVDDAEERLSPSGRSALLAVLHQITGALLLSRREARISIGHFEHAAQLLGRASSEAEEEEEHTLSSIAAANRVEADVAAPGGSAGRALLFFSLAVPSLKLHTAAANASVVCARMVANDMFNEANVRAIESSIETVEHIVGDKHPFYCRLVALLGQLTRFSNSSFEAGNNSANIHVTMLRTREIVRSGLCVPSLDAVVIACCCALSSLQQAEATVVPRAPTGPERAKRLSLAIGFCEEAVEIIAECDRLYGNTTATEYSLEFVVEPACLAVFSAVHEPLPGLVVGRLEERIAAIRSRYGETSLRLMEPLMNLGLASYLAGSYATAHHYLSRSLKVADTINLIFLLGHLFRPAVHLTGTQIQERNRVASDRLQIHQSVQFAAVLFAIAGVYVAQGNADDAQSTYLQAQAALELAHMQTSLATTLILINLSKFLYSEGHYGDAMAHAERAHSTLREFHLSVGSDSNNEYSVVPTAGKVHATRVEEVMEIIRERTRSKGYMLNKQYDGRHRFVVYL